MAARLHQACVPQARALLHGKPHRHASQSHMQYQITSLCRVVFFLFLVLTPLLSLENVSVLSLSSWQICSLFCSAGQVRPFMFWGALSQQGEKEHFASVEGRSLFWRSGHRTTKGMSLLSITGVRISATFWESERKKAWSWGVSHRLWQ